MDETRDSKPKSPHFVGLMASGSILLAGFTVSTYCVQLRGPGLAQRISAHTPEWIVLGAVLLGLAIAVHLTVVRALQAARGAASVRGVLRRALEVLGTAPEVAEGSSETLPREVRDLVSLFAAQRSREYELERELQGARREMKDLLQRLEQSSARREPMVAEGVSDFVGRVARAWNQVLAPAGPATAAPDSPMSSRLAALGASALEPMSASLDEPLAALDSALAALRAPLAGMETTPEALAAEAMAEDDEAVQAAETGPRFETFPTFATEPMAEESPAFAAPPGPMTPEISRRLHELESRFSQLREEMLAMQTFPTESPIVEAVPILEPEIVLDESASAALPAAVPLFLEPEAEIEPEVEPEIESEVVAEVESPDPAWPTWPQAAGPAAPAAPDLSPEEDIRYSRSEVRPEHPTKAGESGYFEWTGQSRELGSWKLREEAAKELTRASEASAPASPEASASGSVVKGTPSFEARFPHFVGKPVGDLEGRVAVSFEGGATKREGYRLDEEPEGGGEAGSGWGRSPGGMERRE